MPARRRRHLPMALMALLDDPKLLLKAPTTSPTAGVHHFETTNLRTIRMPSHKDSQQQITRERKAAHAEWLRCSLGSRRGHLQLF